MGVVGVVFVVALYSTGILINPETVLVVVMERVVVIQRSVRRTDKST